MLKVSELHKYDEANEVIIYEDGSEKNYNDISVKIDIYQIRVSGWFFDIANWMVEDGASPEDYIAVMVALSYLEGVQQFREGRETPRNCSGQWFKKSVWGSNRQRKESIMGRSPMWVISCRIYKRKSLPIT